MDTNISDSDANARLANFIDKDSVDGWVKNSAATCVNCCITAGNNGLMSPDDNITRAETVTMVMRTPQKANLI